MFEAKTLYPNRFTAADIQIDVLPDAVWSAPDTYEKEVLRVWKLKETEAHNANGRIWDGIYYRVTNVADMANSKSISLKLGTVPYRYVTTAYSLKDSFTQHKLAPLHHLSTAAMLRTRDDEYLFGKRSLNGTIDLIGGGAQPDELVIRSGIDLERNVLREIHEEAGLQSFHIESVQGLGIVQSITTNVVLVFLVQINLSTAEAKEVFKGREDAEMADLVAVPENNLKLYLQGMPSYRPLIADLL